MLLGYQWDTDITISFPCQKVTQTEDTVSPRCFDTFTYLTLIHNSRIDVLRGQEIFTEYTRLSAENADGDVISFDDF